MGGRFGYDCGMADATKAPLRPLSSEQQQALLQPPRVSYPVERLRILRQATSGLRLRTEVTADMYRPR